ncbi:MAG: hypothetical protein J0M19_09160 [Sphingomonadales bacterium]|nr:hypothetical protein [Sphingomonadales bacterium]
MTTLRRLDPLFIVLLLAATLTLRLAIPAGFMPVAAPGGIEVRLCSGAGMTSVVLDPAAPGDDQPRDPCPYGLAMGLALDVPQEPVLAEAPQFAAPAWRGLIAARLVAARSLRPPARGPPAFA